MNYFHLSAFFGTIINAKLLEIFKLFVRVHYQPDIDFRGKSDCRLIEIVSNNFL